MLLSVENWHTRRAFGDEGAVETIARAGFDGIDYSFNDMFDWDEAILAPGAAGRAEKLRLCAEKNGVRFIQAHAPFHFLYGMEMSESEREFYSIVRAMEHASWLGVPVIVVHGIDVPGYVDVFDYNARFYNALEPYCRRFGIKAAVENLFEYYADGTVTGVKFGTAQSYCKMIDMLDPECFTGCVDVGHARLTGNRPGDFIRSAGRRVGCVHMHCNDGKRDMHMLPRLVPFEWEDIMSALDETKYSGTFNFELIGYLGRFEKELLPQALQFAAAVGRRLIEMRRQ